MDRFGYGRQPALDGSPTVDIGYEGDPSFIGETIRRYVVERFRPDRAVADSESLSSAKVTDSVSVLDLVTFLEDAFGLIVPARDIQPENFDSIAGAARYARARLGSASPTHEDLRALSPSLR